MLQFGFAVALGVLVHHRHAGRWSARNSISVRSACSGSRPAMDLIPPRDKPFVPWQAAQLAAHARAWRSNDGVLARALLAGPQRCKAEPKAKRRQTT